MQNLEDEISKTPIFSRRGFGGKRKSKTQIDEKSLFKKLMKRYPKLPIMGKPISTVSSSLITVIVHRDMKTFVMDFILALIHD